MARHNEIGKIGEQVAQKWLKTKGFTIKDINYRKKYGEIDIVARGTTGKVHFVEVKTVSYETKQDLELAVLRGTYRPEDNVHFHKQQRFSRVIESWILENDYSGEWQIDIVTVRMVPREKYAQVKFIENVIFE